MKRAVTFYSEGVRLVGDVYYPEDVSPGEERAGQPKKLVVLNGYGHYEVYAEPAFSGVMQATLAWYQEHLPAR